MWDILDDKQLLSLFLFGNKAAKNESGEPKNLLSGWYAEENTWKIKGGPDMKLGSTLWDFRIHPFAILWYKPCVIQDSISWIEWRDTLMTFLVQTDKDWSFPKM